MKALFAVTILPSGCKTMSLIESDSLKRLLTLPELPKVLSGLPAHDGRMAKPGKIALNKKVRMKSVLKMEKTGKFIVLTNIFADEAKASLNSNFIFNIILGFRRFNVLTKQVKIIH